MGYGTDVRVQLRRDSPGVSWGFRLQGGKEYGGPLAVQRVFNGSPCDGQLQRGDVIVAVDNHDVRNASQSQAQEFIQNSGLVLTLAIERSGSSNYDAYVPPSDNHGYTQHQAAVPKQFPSPSHQQPQQDSWKPVPSFSTQSPPQSYYGHQPSNGMHDQAGSNRDLASQDVGGPPPVYRSATATATFSPSGQGQGYPSQSSGGQGYVPSQQAAGQGMEFDQWGNFERTKAAQQHGKSSDVGDDENYEQKTVGNIKQMFNKDDEVGTQRVTPHIKRAHPRAPMRHANEESSFSNPHFGPTASAPKSSLTPSRPGAIQRGAPDTHHSTYIPTTRPEHHSTQRTPGLYGYGQDQGPGNTGGYKGKYVGGFVGVNALIKPEAPAAPIKKPPGQKKDFDPTHSSVLRVLQEEEERSKSSPRGGQPRPDSDQAARYEAHGRHPQMSKGQQWQQQQQHATDRPAQPKHGGSLQALLEKDLKQNPQEDPRVQHDPHLAPPCAAPGKAEYRRPGTNYKPAENQAKTFSLDDYPLHSPSTDRYDYPSPSSYPASDTYRSTATFTSGGTANQAPSSGYSPNKSAPQTYQGYQQFDYPSRQSYQSAPYSQYPASDYMGGIPACDF